MPPSVDSYPRNGFSKVVLGANGSTTNGRRFLASVAEQFGSYGKGIFRGKLADDYLFKHGGSVDMLKDPSWVAHSSDIVAAAVFDWYVSCNLLFD